MGDWVLGENYKGNHNEHVEVNRFLKKYNERDIPYFRATTPSFLTQSAALTSLVVFNGRAH